MLEIKEDINLEESLQRFAQQLQKISDEESIEHSYNNETERIASDDLESLKLLSEESDGTLLFSCIARSNVTSTATYEDQRDKDDRQENTTYIAMYDRNNNSVKVIHRLKTITEIVNATISHNHAFLAFVTRGETSNISEYKSAGSTCIYSAYITEICSSTRQTHLVLPVRSQNILLQFLYPNNGSTHNNSTNGKQEVHLLVILHMDSVRQYDYTYSRNRKNEMILDSYPRRNAILHRRVRWAQWDHLQQKLYAVYLRPHPSTPYSLRVHQNQSTTVLIGFQFSGHGSHQPFLKVDLKLQHNFTSPAIGHYYLDLLPRKTITDSNLCLQLLTTTSGALCVCQQHLVSEPTRPAQRQKTTGSSGNICYSIILIHCEKKIVCETRQSFTEVITFALLGDHLLAHLPGRFTHVYNIGIYTAPELCVHWTEDFERRSFDLEKQSQVDTSCCLIPLQSPNQASGFRAYDKIQNTICRVQLSHDFLIKSFNKSGSESAKSRIRVLRYITSQPDDQELLEKIFKCIKNSCCLERGHLLEEFILGWTFKQMIPVMNPYVLSALPYSATHDAVSNGIFAMSSDQNSSATSALEMHAMITDEELIPEVADLKGAGGLSLSRWSSLHPQLNRPSQPRQREQCQLNIEYNRLYEQKGSSKLNPYLAGKLQERQWIRPTASTNSKASLTSSSSSVSSFSLLSDASVSIPSASPNMFSMNNMSKADGNSSRLDAEFMTSISSTCNVISLSERVSIFSIEELSIDVITLLHTDSADATVDVLSKYLMLLFPRQSKTSQKNAAENYVRHQVHAVYKVCELIWIACSDEKDENNVYRTHNLTEPASREEFEMWMFLASLQSAIKSLSLPTPHFLPHFLLSLSFRTHTRTVFLGQLQHRVLPANVEFCKKLISDLEDNEDNIRLKFRVIQHLPVRSERMICLREWDLPEAKILFKRLLLEQSVRSSDNSLQMSRRYRPGSSNPFNRIKKKLEELYEQSFRHSITLITSAI